VCLWMGVYLCVYVCVLILCVYLVCLCCVFMCVCLSCVFMLCVLSGLALSYLVCLCVCVYVCVSRVLLSRLATCRQDMTHTHSLHDTHTLAT